MTIDLSGDEITTLILALDSDIDTRTKRAKVFGDEPKLKWLESDEQEHIEKDLKVKAVLEAAIKEE